MSLLPSPPWSPLYRLEAPFSALKRFDFLDFGLQDFWRFFNIFQSPKLEQGERHFFLGAPACVQHFLQKLLQGFQASFAKHSGFLIKNGLFWHFFKVRFFFLKLLDFGLQSLSGRGHFFEDDFSKSALFPKKTRKRYIFGPFLTPKNHFSSVF